MNTPETVKYLPVIERGPFIDFLCQGGLKCFDVSYLLYYLQNEVKIQKNVLYNYIYLSYDGIKPYIAYRRSSHVWEYLRKNGS